MVAVVDGAGLTAAPAPPARRLGRSGRRRPSVFRAVVLFIAAVYFLVPLYAALRFALRSPSGGWSFSAFKSIPSQDGFGSAFELSIKLAVVTTVITLVLMLPTAVFVHLRLPRLRRLMDGLTILPVVIPPVVLIVGVLQVMPTKLTSTSYLLSLEYVVLAMPFAYRAFDAGLRALDLKTLVEASRSLGGGWITTLWRVLLPNLRAAILSATVLTVALVLGEYTMATLDQYQTFSVWIVQFDQSNGQISVAASFTALLVTWVVLLLIAVLGGRQRGRRLRREEG